LCVARALCDADESGVCLGTDLVREYAMSDTREKDTGGSGPRSQDRRDSAGESGGNMGAGKSGKEDLGTEKPQEDRGSNRPNQGAGGKDAVDDDPSR
jgi:hypothetical protein